MTHTTAKIIADTAHPQVPAARITTFEVYAPRFLLAEINTHRVIAKSAASSRAIPVAKRIEMVGSAPFVPLAFGKNQPGMVADGDLDEDTNAAAKDVWLRGTMYAIMIATDLNDLDVHKQLANRVLEPYAYVHGVMTATEWDNFWDLRTASDAQPEFQELAVKMREVYDASKPKSNRFHLPYTDDLDPRDFTTEELRKVSASRCARVSYTYHDGKPFSLERDLKRCDDLITGKHMSPFDQVATADSCGWQNGVGPKLEWDNPESHRQFWGWIPYRVVVEKRIGYVGRRSSFKPFTV